MDSTLYEPLEQLRHFSILHLSLYTHYKCHYITESVPYSKQE